MRISNTLSCISCPLLAIPALAQQPMPGKNAPSLLGRWQARRIYFFLSRTDPDHGGATFDNPASVALNQGFLTGQARLEADFRPDSTYGFTVWSGSQVQRTESGTFCLRGRQLNASAPTSPDGSSFHDQQIRYLTRRQLALSFPIEPAEAGVSEVVEYERVGPPPATAK